MHAGLKHFFVLHAISLKTFKMIANFWMLLLLYVGWKCNYLSLHGNNYSKINLVTWSPGKYNCRFDLIALNCFLFCLFCFLVEKCYSSWNSWVWKLNSGTRSEFRQQFNGWTYFLVQILVFRMYWALNQLGNGTCQTIQMVV